MFELMVVIVVLILGYVGVFVGFVLVGFGVEVLSLFVFLYVVVGLMIVVLLVSLKICV